MTDSVHRALLDKAFTLKETEHGGKFFAKGAVSQPPRFAFLMSSPSTLPTAANSRVRFLGTLCRSPPAHAFRPYLPFLLQCPAFRR